MENMDKMKKTDLELRYHSNTEEWVVIKVKDELTKNHKNIKNLVSGIMPKNKTDWMCPVKSFRTYIEHLNPKNEYMWQYALNTINPANPDIWYSKKHFGKNPLATFMSTLSKQVGLSQIYTNHSIRATGITVLTNNKFSNADIMSVSGHKSIQSLTVYQKTDDKKKILMGKALSDSTMKQNKPSAIKPGSPKLALPSAPSTLQIDVLPQSEKAAAPKQNVTDAMIPFQADFNDENDIPDFVLLTAICDMEEKQEVATIPVTKAVSNTSNVINQIPKSFFANCQIGTLNLNVIQK